MHQVLYAEVQVGRKVGRVGTKGKTIYRKRLLCVPVLGEEPRGCDAIGREYLEEISNLGRTKEDEYDIE